MPKITAKTLKKALQIDRALGLPIFNVQDGYLVRVDARGKQTSLRNAIFGNISIGEGTHVGAGAIVLPNLSIGKWVKIGAGAVVINDLPDEVTVVGNPARIIKQKHA